MERQHWKFDKKVEDYYQLERLSPSYRVFFGKEDIVDVPSDLKEFYAMIESLEPGSGPGLKKFLKESEEKYKAGMEDLVYSPGNSAMEFVNTKTIGGFFKLDLFE